MTGKWRVMSLEAAPLEIIDGDRGTNYPNQAEFCSTGHCLFLNAGNVTTAGFKFSDCVFITEGKDALLRKGKLIRNDVVLTTRGTVGNTVYYDEFIPFDHIRINSGMVILRAQVPDLQPRYLYFFVRSELFHAQVSALCTGSAQPQLPIRDINKIKIPIPPPEEQRSIAHILGTLEDKIELNRKMNETLEAMARAIFKSWFVDFDPIPGLSPHKEWQDSSLGRISKGWRVESIGDVIELAYGRALKEDVRQPGHIPVYGSNGQVGWHNKKLVDGPGIVVGRKGNPGIITWIPTDFYAIDTTFYVIPKGIIRSKHYLYHVLQLQDLPSLGADSAVPGLNRNMAYMNKMLVPSHEIISYFDDQVKPLTDKVYHNNTQSRTLASIRDALLPKLLSGEIRVKNMESFVGRNI